MLTTIEQVESASLNELLYTWRFAPVGAVDNNIMDLIGERMREICLQDSGAWVTASKQVGWE